MLDCFNDPLALAAAVPPPRAPNPTEEPREEAYDDAALLEKAELRELPPEEGVRPPLSRVAVMPPSRLGLQWTSDGSHVRPIEAMSLSRWQPTDAAKPLSSELEPSDGPRLCVACMLRAAPLAAVDGFLRYYHAIGFEHIILFFDKPDEDAPAIALAEAHEREVGGGVTIHRCDAAWWAEEHKRGRTFVRARAAAQTRGGTDNSFGHLRWISDAETAQLIDHTDDVQARQCAVMCRASTDAWAAGYDWLLQLDIDELLYLPRRAEREDARRYFATVAADVDVLAFHNHEVMPCESLELPDGDWFTCTLFKVSPHLLADYTDSEREQESRLMSPNQP